MENITILAIVILAFLLGTVYYSFFIMGKPDQNENEDVWSVKPKCSEGETAPCTIDSCTGMRRCEHGVWSSCRLEMTCEPGSREFCYENSCVDGYRICNECGTGYWECILN